MRRHEKESAPSRAQEARMLVRRQRHARERAAVAHTCIYVDAAVVSVRLKIIPGCMPVDDKQAFKLPPIRPAMCI